MRCRRSFPSPLTCASPCTPVPANSHPEYPLILQQTTCPTRASTSLSPSSPSSGVCPSSPVHGIVIRSPPASRLSVFPLFLSHLMHYSRVTRERDSVPVYLCSRSQSHCRSLLCHSTAAYVIQVRWLCVMCCCFCRCVRESGNRHAGCLATTVTPRF